MFNRTAAMLAATILAGTTTIAGAQSPSTGSAGTGQPGVNVNAQADTSASRFEQRSALRRQLRSEGFQDIRISDAMFAVQARTPDGRSVLMIANPTGEQASATGQTSSRQARPAQNEVSQQSASDQRGARRAAQRDQLQQQGQRTGREVASARDGMDQTRAVPVRLPDGRTVLVLVTPADEGQPSQGQPSQGQISQDQTSQGTGSQNRQASASREGASGQGNEGRADDRPGTNSYSYNWDHPHAGQRLNRQGDSASANAGNRGESRQVARSDDRASGVDTSDDASAVESAVREQYTGAISSELMSADRARSRLESQGFSNVGNWQREGDTYTGTADRHGEEVDFRFDARRGEVVEPSTLGRGQVETLLSEAGFSNVEGVQQLGNTFRANAERDGMRYLVRVDAETGEILNRRPIREG